MAPWISERGLPPPLEDSVGPQRNQGSAAQTYSYSVPTFILFGLSTLVILLRFFTRGFLLRSFGSDDVFAGLAWVSSLPGIERGREGEIGWNSSMRFGADGSADDRCSRGRPPVWSGMRSGWIRRRLQTSTPQCSRSCHFDLRFVFLLPLPPPYHHDIY